MQNTSKAYKIAKEDYFEKISKNHYYFFVYRH